MTKVVTPTAYAAGYTSVTTKFDTGREQFTSFYPCAAFASDCILTAHLYYAWGMHGILPGARDSLFSVQVRLSDRQIHDGHSVNIRCLPQPRLVCLPADPQQIHAAITCPPPLSVPTACQIPGRS